MLRVSKLTDYATVVMSVMAEDASSVLSASELATRAGLETTTVAKVLKPLAQAGLVEGFRGSNGGYRLARKPGLITLADIVEALEGPLAMTECSTHGSRCGIQAHCDARPKWLRVNAVIAEALRGISLQSMHAHPSSAMTRRPIPAVLAES